METLNENNHQTKCVLSSLQLVLEYENIVHYDEIQFKSTCATCCGPTIVSVAPHHHSPFFPKHFRWPLVLHPPFVISFFPESLKR